MEEKQEKKRYTKKQKMHYFAERSKKGAVKKNGEPLSDFERGRNFGRSEEIGKQLGTHKYKCAEAAGDTATMEQMRATSAAIRAKRDQARADYKAAKAAEAALKAAQKAEKKAAKKGGEK